VLLFIGIKMLVSGVVTIPIGISLATVAVILLFSVLLSLLRPPAKQ
jgi:tellurite resistance protein TerC